MKKKATIVGYSADELRGMRERGESRTDWAKMERIGDDELERLIAEDGEEAPLPEGWPEGVTIGLPRRKRHMNLRIDADVVDWFRRQGRGYQTRMNAVLRAFMNAHRRGRL